MRKRFKAKSIFISGMSGKTLAKNLVLSALSEKYRVFTHKDEKILPEDVWTYLHPFDEIDLEEFRDVSPISVRRAARSLTPDVWAVLDSMGKSETELEEYVSAIKCGAKTLVFNADSPALSRLAEKYGAVLFSAADLKNAPLIPGTAKSFAAAKKIAQLFGTDAEKAFDRFDKFGYTKNIFDIDGVKLIVSAAVKCADDAAGAVALSGEDSLVVFGAPDLDFDFENYLDLAGKARGRIVLYGDKMCEYNTKFPKASAVRDNVSLEALLLSQLPDSSALILVGGRCADFSRTLRRIFGLCDGNIAEEYKKY